MISEKPTFSYTDMISSYGNNQSDFAKIGGQNTF